MGHDRSQPSDSWQPGGVGSCSVVRMNFQPGLAWPAILVNTERAIPCNCTVAAGPSVETWAASRRPELNRSLAGTSIKTSYGPDRFLPVTGGTVRANSHSELAREGPLWAVAKSHVCSSFKTTSRNITGTSPFLLNSSLV